MAVAAEQLDLSFINFEIDFSKEQFADPLIEVIPDRPEDVGVRLKATQFIGSCLASREVSIQPEALRVQPIESLHDAIQQAAAGNATAKKMVTTNVATDVIERTIKAGHVMEVALEVDEAGRIQQFGQHLETVQANTLRLASDNWQKLERSKAEATNSFRLHEMLRTGELRDHSFVVLSRAADNMSKEQMDDEGFFTDTMSMAIQVTTERNGQLFTETAFVAGVSEPGAVRHDADTVIVLGDQLGVDFRGKSAAEIIDMPLLIDNSLIPNGAIDLVVQYDNCAGGTFFGEDKPRQDYRQFRKECRQRELQLQPKVAAITEELIAEAQTIIDPIHATQRLNKLSGRHMVQQAMFDHTIDPRVFGPAAEHIVAGRLLFERGEIEAGLAQTELAVKTERSSTCPGGPGSSKDAQENNANEKPKDCEFVSNKCPICGEKNALTRVRNGRYHHVGKGCTR